ncbi:MAG: site-2 protease family protein [Lachnospiraceae bacterium]|nr:site-2 protease family protein [Lachnospiraceae bacterium]
MIATLIWFILILSVIVISHEFGHFIVARANGIRVNEFDVGMGPTLISFKKGETTFALKLLPLGGACVFDPIEDLDISSDVGKKEKNIAANANVNVNAGEDGEASLYVQKNDDISLYDNDIDKDPHAYKNATVWARISTVVAGPIFNFILAMIFSMIIVAECGTDLPTVAGLTEGRPAATSGISEGDTIVSINGEKIHVWRDISLISILNDGEPLEFEYLHEGRKLTTTITPKYSEEEGRYFIGIEGGADQMECKGANLFKYSWYELVFNFRNTLKSLKQLVLGKLSRDAVSGPVGIAQVVGESYDVAKDYGVSSVVLTMMNIAMLLSVNLGVINLLPLPAIDGGRLVFLLIELVRRKPVPPKYEGYVHIAGFIMFFIITILVLFNDISKFF